MTIREKKSRLRFLNQQYRWLKLDLREPRASTEIIKIRKFIENNRIEANRLKEELK